MTKWDFTHKIRESLNLPYDSVGICDGEDKDKRDYLISNKKIEKIYKCRYGIDYGVRELVKLFDIFSKEETAKMRNI